MNLTEEERKLRIKQFKEELERRKQKKTGKKEEKKEEKKDIKYPFCVNDKDYITLENVNDILKGRLVKIHYLGKIHCLEASTFYNSLIHPKLIFAKRRVRNRYVFSELEIYKLPLSFSVDYLRSTKNKIKKAARKGISHYRLKKSNSKYEGLGGELNIMNIEPFTKEEIKKIEEENKKPVEEKKKPIEKKKKKNYTVKELKKMCKDNKIKGYSKLTKAELVKKCLSKQKKEENKPEEKKKKKKYTVKELKKKCKDKKIKGYSKLKKAELLKKCL